MKKPGTKKPVKKPGTKKPVKKPGTKKPTKKPGGGGGGGGQVDLKLHAFAWVIPAAWLLLILVALLGLVPFWMAAVAFVVVGVVWGVALGKFSDNMKRAVAFHKEHWVKTLGVGACLLCSIVAVWWWRRRRGGGGYGGGGYSGGGY